MSTNTGEIQPVASGPWVAPELNRKDVQAVAPVVKVEGGTAAKVGGDKTGGENTASSSDSETTDQIIQQVQSFLNETTSIELNFVVQGHGKSYVQVLDRNSGKVIREIPPDKFAAFRDKLEELRGMLFDSKA